MNINLNNHNITRLFYSAVISSLMFLPSSCLAQTTSSAPSVQSSPTPSKMPLDNKFKCKSPEETEKIQTPTEWTGSELNRAVIRRDVAALRKLLQKKANPNEKDNYGNTPLINAVTGLAITEPTEPGKSPEIRRRQLQKEAQAQIEMVRELLKYGADANLRGALGTTALIEAAFWSYTFDQAVKISTLLIEHKADVNFQNESGNTALINAAHFSSTEPVKLLLAHGANVSLTNCKNETALSIAQANKNADVMSVLQNAN